MAYRFNSGGHSDGDYVLFDPIPNFDWNTQDWTLVVKHRYDQTMDLNNQFLCVSHTSTDGVTLDWPAFRLEWDTGTYLFARGFSALNSGAGAKVGWNHTGGAGIGLTHIFTHDSTQTGANPDAKWKSYANGGAARTAFNTNTTTAALVTADGKIELGNAGIHTTGIGTSEGFEGSVYEVAVYDYVMSAAEHDVLHGNGAATSISENQSCRFYNPSHLLLYADLTGPNPIDIVNGQPVSVVGASLIPSPVPEIPYWAKSDFVFAPNQLEDTYVRRRSTYLRRYVG